MADVLIVAGEESGDILAESIIRSWPGKKKPKFFGFGGQRMKKAGVEILRTTDELATIGIIEALKNYRRLRGYFYQLLAEAEKRGVKSAILVDFPGFNLRIAGKLKKKGIDCHFVVSPQIWAWHYSRVKTMRKILKSILCLYDFETAIYDKEGIPSFFMGHPLVDIALKSKRSLPPAKNKARTIGLLPGSRGSEVRGLFPFMVDVARAFHEKHSEYKFLVPVANERAARIMKEVVPDLPDFIRISDKGTHSVLHNVHAAVVCSGTVTLECALFEVPITILYRMHPLTFFLGKRLVRIPYVGMVNVIRGKFIAREFLQKDVQLEKVLPELEKLVFDRGYRDSMKKELKLVQNSLGKGGAAKKAAAYLAAQVQ